MAKYKCGNEGCICARHPNVWHDDTTPRWQQVSDEPAQARIDEYPYGHVERSLSLSDFGCGWSCHACLQHGDEYTHPGDYPCGPAIDSYCI